MRFLIGFLVLGFSLNALAIETARCPERVKVDISIDKVYQSSIYKSEPGWQEAKKALDGITGVLIHYNLKKKNEKSCFYGSNDGDTANLSTTEFMDPEENGPILIDQFIPRFYVDGAEFVTFLPVKEYQSSGLELRSSPFKVRVKARFDYSKTGKPLNVSMGMISVTIK